MRFLFPLFALFFALPAFAQINPGVDDAIVAVPDRRQSLLCRQRGPGRLPGHDAGREHSHQCQPRHLAAADSREHRKAGLPLGGHENPARWTGALRPHGRGGRNPARDTREEHGHGRRCRGGRKRRSRTDFLAASGSVPPYPPAHVDRVLHDGDTVDLGGVTLTAHKTAGHTRGCTTWTFPVHLPGEAADRVRNVVIVGGVSFLVGLSLH